MAIQKLNNIEQKLANSSGFVKALMAFIVGTVLIFLLRIPFSFDFFPAFTLLVLLSLFVMWLHYCSCKQLQVLQECLQEEELFNDDQFKGALTRLCGYLKQQKRSTKNNTDKHSNTVNQLNDTAEQLNSCMEIINEAVSEEFEQIELLVTAMNEMTSTVKGVESNAESASSSTAEATEVAEEGRSAVNATISSINLLSENIDASAVAVNTVEAKVESIGSVVETIRSISEQTNLLALNAAIEAARAGEAGRGFAVVADEVRNLAKRTQDATVEIQGMIEQLQKSAQQAVNLMENSVKEADVGVSQVTQAGIKLSDIVEKVNYTSEMNCQIASVAKEQTTVVDEINANLEQVKETVEGSVMVIKEVSEMSGELYNLSSALK